MRAMALLSEQQKAIINECDEITLDFMPLNSEAMIFVPPKLVVIGYGELTDEFLALCVNEEHTHKLEIAHLLPQDFVGLSGSLGQFELTFKDANGEIKELKTAQIVSFAPLKNCPTRKGVHTPDTYKDADSMLEALLALCGEQHYHHHIAFSPTYCQFQSRRPLHAHSTCQLCVNICPTMCISSDKDSMLLAFSHIDCIACGKCVSVCPTGSLQRLGDGLESFTHKARMYNGLVPLLVAKSDVDSMRFYDELKALLALNPLLTPFILQAPDMLNMTYLLTLLQESGAQIVLYSAFSEHVNNDIASLNDIYGHIFAQMAFISHKDTELIARLSPLPQSHYIYTPTQNESSKDILSTRLAFWVKNVDYGAVSANNAGILHINANQCTLCLSCVAACNTNALINNNSSFELLYKASLCTDCGYCATSCAENVLHLESNTIALSPQSFTYTKIANDEPFRCVECNKIFATQRSITKILHILAHAPAFSDNPLKLRTLQCCADCKVKVMFEVAR